ncbi:MAG: transcription termination/antitermination protein NusG [Actinomycetota bacterium]
MTLEDPPETRDDEAEEPQEPAEPAETEEPSGSPDPTEAEEPPAEEAALRLVEPEPNGEEPAAEEAAAVVKAPSGADPYGGPGEWYVIHTYAGYENKVKTNLESRIHTMQMQDKIFDVVIPMEDVMEIKGGKKQVVQKKVFPGYLLVKMVYDDDSWYVVRNTPGVTGFVSSGTGQKPTPLSRREVEKILAVKKEEVKPAFRLDFEEGDVVRIISGPFADFNGTISDINVDQSKVRVMVNIFDRETPVELSFDQVARV